MEFEIIVKKLNNELSPKEKIAFDKWYHASAKHRAYYVKVRNNYLKEAKLVKTDDAWKFISSKIEKDQKNQYFKIALAASILGIIGLSIFFQFINDQPVSTILNPSAISVTDFRNDKAILTLGNGTEIDLTNKTYQTTHIKSNGSQIVYEPLKHQFTDEAIVYNYLTVPRGGEYFIKFSDGTEVWLNSDTKLKYPVQFTERFRKIELIYGEAYFNVSSSTMHQGASFIVGTPDQVVEVQGTKFNIKAYKEDEIITTTLVEGKVTVINSETKIKEFLIPNQQLALNTITNKYSIQKVNPKNFICWKNGLFTFKNKSLEDIMIVLSRWYDIEVTFRNEKLKERKFNGVFRKNQQIENILESIERTRKAAFDIKGGKIYVETIISSEDSSNK
ncbi:FecR family protein [Autumnicola musiva]|uniref:FecR family protein n=1 Tax=Autumnicola musiva TaxID=3075589 RepID=A0ABU3D9W5_9FLAO|nr:FecR family protein [Zunongwangia sp. F117]MDT0678331.1 FecR family protein [Zunongwangia sp. F117]